MLRLGKRFGRGLLRMCGYELVASRCADAARTEFPPDFDDETASTCRFVQPYTMTSLERIYSLCNSVRYVVRHEIPGDIVECGTWRGGSMMAVAKTLQALNCQRKLYLFDTFDGMPPPAEIDATFSGESAANILAAEDKLSGGNWAFSPLEEVRENLRKTGYDETQITFVKGKVEDTIPYEAPDQISLLRLDTDWYESTYHELVHLFPRLSVGGVIIIDDYGHWQGARKAVDEYLMQQNLKILLHRIDYTGRIAVKID